MKMFYRYVDRIGDYGFAGIRLKEFVAVKETPCGFWIRSIFKTCSKQKWVSKTARRRFAYPAKIEAMRSYQARKRYQLDICEYRLRVAEDALRLSDHMLHKLEVGDE